VLGLDALVMLKRSFFPGVCRSLGFGPAIPLLFTSLSPIAYLNDLGVKSAAGKMALGQVSEVGMNAADALHSPAGKREKYSADGDAGLVSTLHVARLRQCEWWHVDVLCSDSATWHLL